VECGVQCAVHSTLYTGSGEVSCEPAPRELNTRRRRHCCPAAWRAGIGRGVAQAYKDFVNKYVAENAALKLFYS